ncbi:prepilin-type N-terminal cleavage/methylation domain-containing protein [Geopsychrobacter electrodiphilus]|uniref:prepilin-type N-terminal cleavage/methylation domain-containing protein n=1 Tax=Geopsychrobacter electrodiphilus TaxID=225196 RepID=UPI00036B21FC|nr:prepilin-type N-terminal cleavage/methylation domain-containing protein [Geopsychrobacter electrodiphilus]
MIGLRRALNQQGVTLIELIVVMVVISIALVGVMSVINYTTLHSADPMLRQQSIAIAEAYMEEISLKSYTDPGGPVELGRADFDDVADYNGLTDNGAHDQTGAAIMGLESYTVQVTVGSASFGIPAVAGLKIDVTVTDPAGETLTLTGYRTDY